MTYVELNLLKHSCMHMRIFIKPGNASSGTSVLASARIKYVYPLVAYGKKAVKTWGSQILVFTDRCLFAELVIVLNWRIAKTSF